MSLSELFTNNYEYLNTVAKRITRHKDIKLAPELLNTTYLAAFEKQEKGDCIPQDDLGFVKWFSMFMKNCFMWPNSNFNSGSTLTVDSNVTFSIDAQYFKLNGGWRNKKVRVSTDPESRDDEEIIDGDALRDMELGAESVSDRTKEFIAEITYLSTKQALKLTEVLEFKRSLPRHEEILFELYFEKELSTRRIAELYSDETNTMNYQSVNKMVNIIKSKIKNYQWKQSTT